jgi:pimeloyl-ACP methyl ester carboxylesterase
VTVPVVHSAGVDLDVRQQGSGPRLVFLQGSGSTLEESTPLIGTFAPGFALTAFDYRGLGRSGPAPGAYAMADCAGDALAVMDAAGWESARVLGISFGGMVALELAVSAPERVERLALLCTSAGGGGGSSYPLHELEALDPAERSRRRVLLMDTRFDDAWLASHPGDRALVEALDSRGPGPDASQRSGHLHQLEARRHHDVWDRLPLIACATFIGCGRFDGIAPPANSAALASRIPGAQLHTYEGGHAFLAQDRRSIGEVRDFLSR